MRPDDAYRGGLKYGRYAARIVYDRRVTRTQRHAELIAYELLGSALDRVGRRVHTARGDPDAVHGEGQRRRAAALKRRAARCRRQRRDQCLGAADVLFLEPRAQPRETDRRDHPDEDDHDDHFDGAEAFSTHGTPCSTAPYYRFYAWA